MQRKHMRQQGRRKNADSMPGQLRRGNVINRDQFIDSRQLQLLVSFVVWVNKLCMQRESTKKDLQNLTIFLFSQWTFSMIREWKCKSAESVTHFSLAVFLEWYGEQRLSPIKREKEASHQTLCDNVANFTQGIIWDPVGNWDVRRAGSS